MKNKLTFFFSLWMMFGLHAIADSITPVLDFGTYTLGNHCCGNAEEADGTPLAGLYGLRLDEFEGPDPQQRRMWLDDRLNWP